MVSHGGVGYHGRGAALLPAQDAKPGSWKSGWSSAPDRYAWSRTSRGDSVSGYRAAVGAEVAKLEANILGRSPLELATFVRKRRNCW